MDFDPNLPIYQQIVDSIKQMIIKGELQSGDKIKPVRELAQEMRVNPNTMQKALSALEAEDLLYSERTSGRFVTQNIENIQLLREKMVYKIIIQYFRAMKQMGFSEEESIKMITEFKEDQRCQFLQ